MLTGMWPIQMNESYPQHKRSRKLFEESGTDIRCRQKGVVRMIKLPARVDDYAYLLKEDYDACIENAAQEQRVSHFQTMPSYRETLLCGLRKQQHVFPPPNIHSWDFKDPIFCDGKLASIPLQPMHCSMSSMAERPLHLALQEIGTALVRILPDCKMTLISM